MAVNFRLKKPSTEYRSIPVSFRLKAGICLFLTLYGMFLCMEHILLSQTEPKTMFLLAGLLLILAEIMYLGSRQRLAVSLLYAAVLGAAVRQNQQIFTEGAKEIANRILNLVNRYYRTEYLTWFVRPKGEEKIWCFVLLCALAGFLEILLFVSVSSGAFVANKSAFKKWKERAAFLGIPAVLLVLGCYVGISPPRTGMLLILTGFLAVNLEPEEKRAWIPGVGLAAILALSAAFSESSLARQLMERWHEPWYQRQLSLEDQLMELTDKITGIRLFSKNEAQSEYPLGNDKPQQTGKELFRITVDSRPEQTLYLRGFIGGDYEDGSWKAVSKQEFSHWAQSQGLSNQKCRDAVQNYPYQILKEYEKTDREYASRKVTIDLEHPFSGYTLTPYYTEISEEQSAEGDGMLTPLEQKKFLWNSFLFLKDWQREGFHSMDTWKQEVSVGELSVQAEGESIWENYCAYAQQVYTRLPAQGLERVKELTAPYAQLNLWGKQEEGFEKEAETGQEIQQGQALRIPEYRIMQTKMLLWSETEYSQNLEPVPEGRDYTEYFLLEQKKGFCVHYATAGTLILRMFGIPARYVSGYVVFPEDFKRNQDGTYTAVVKDLRGHAWTEVFQSETGFYPLEVTPPLYLDILQELKPGEDADRLLEAKRGAGEKKIQNESSEPKQQEKEENARNLTQEKDLQKEEAAAGKAQNGGTEKESRKDVIPKPVKAAGICLAGAVLMLGLLWRGKRYLRRRREAEFYQADRSKGALAMGKALEKLLQSKGLERKRGMSDQEYGAFLARELPEADWEKAVGIWQKAAFSRQGITEKEFAAAEEFYREMVKKLKK